MNTGNIISNSASDIEVAQNKTVKKNSLQKSEISSSTRHGDAVTISEEGKKKSEAMRIQSDEENTQGSISSEIKNEGEGKVSIDDIKKDLQLKQSETKRKQKQLEELQQQAANDSSKETELHKLKNKIAQLKKEEDKLKSQMYSA